MLVVRWVDHLGRQYDDIGETIRTFMNRGVVIRTIINEMDFDGATEDPMKKAVRDALIAFMAATSQAQAEAIKGAQRAGIAYAKAHAGERYRGRKSSGLLSWIKADAAPRASIGLQRSGAEGEPPVGQET